MRLARRELVVGAALLLVYFGLELALGSWCLTGFPNTGDEHTILFQAKIFAEFRAWAPAPPLPEFFASHAIEIQRGRWFSICPPLFPLLLAPGVWIGSPRAIVALMSCASLALIYLLLKRMGESPRDAALATGLVALSPTFAFHSVSLYTHVGTLLILLVALAQFDAWRAPDGPRLRRPLALGVALGLGFGIRTYTTFLLSLPFALLLLLQWRRGSLRGRALGRAVLGGAGGLVGVMLLNCAVSGYPIDVHFLENARYRLITRQDNPYDWEAVLRWRDMLQDGLRWTFGRGPWSFQNLKFPETGAFPWAIGLLGGGLLAAYVRKPTRADLVLLALMVALVVGHFSFDNSVSGRFGERYFFEIHFIWILLAWKFLRRMGRAPAFALMAASMLLGVVSTAKFFRADNLRRMDPFLQAAALPPGPKIVFLRDGPDFDVSWYARNEPDLTGAVFVRDLGARDPELRKRFPGVPAFLYLHDPATGEWKLRAL